ncbi:nitrate reductase cytochrome c-type subunit [Candidatus Parabeggiatoa sp. HSG14]|uniref:nitrate reductase cytochrome c-type subunit n=1 Tax=Candidatus Parabeggiatoa sp. HSG14 TaxID=3055593 RepID=UPI0025A81C5B|nr:nitrate reductase cytochrome c-type subunit [Thiotrichales bacterium HSG14]
MEKFYVFSLTLVLGSLVCFPQITLSHGDEHDISENSGIESLRGNRSVEGSSQTPSWKNVPSDHEVIQRNYVHQPPLIPHSIEKYEITLKYNKCLICHSWSNYKESNATKISTTHFKDRDGNFLANIAPRHYFCTQCHVPQLEANPLIDNTFEPVQILQK